MPTVEIMLNGRQHVVQCGQGEESRVRQLASYIDRRIADLGRGQAPAGDARLLVLATLKIADELSDAYDEIKRLRTASEERGRGESDVPAGVLEQAAQRIEAIAAALESA
jgi:cell division protein ZapA